MIYPQAPNLPVWQELNSLFLLLLIAVGNMRNTSYKQGVHKL